MWWFCNKFICHSYCSMLKNFRVFNFCCLLYRWKFPIYGIPLRWQWIMPSTWRHRYHNCNTNGMQNTKLPVKWKSYLNITSLRMYRTIAWKLFVNSNNCPVLHKGLDPVSTPVILHIQMPLLFNSTEPCDNTNLCKPTIATAKVRSLHMAAIQFL